MLNLSIASVYVCVQWDVHGMNNICCLHVTQCILYMLLVQMLYVCTPKPEGNVLILFSKGMWLHNVNRF